MYWYVNRDENGDILALIETPVQSAKSGIEITEIEYNIILSEIRDKYQLEDKLYSGEITVDDVPEEYREEVQRRVDERKQADEEPEPLTETETALEEMGVQVYE
jgi:Zn-dependent M32 family carboxypeptidase